MDGNPGSGRTCGRVCLQPPARGPAGWEARPGIPAPGPGSRGGGRGRRALPASRRRVAAGAGPAGDAEEEGQGQGQVQPRAAEPAVPSAPQPSPACARTQGGDRRTVSWPRRGRGAGEPPGGTMAVRFQASSPPRAGGGGDEDEAQLAPGVRAPDGETEAQGFAAGSPRLPLPQAASGGFSGPGSASVTR